MYQLDINFEVTKFFNFLGHLRNSSYKFHRSIKIPGLFMIPLTINDPYKRFSLSKSNALFEELLKGRLRNLKYIKSCICDTLNILCNILKNIVPAHKLSFKTLTCFSKTNSSLITFELISEI